MLMESMMACLSAATRELTLEYYSRKNEETGDDDNSEPDDKGDDTVRL